MNSQPTTTHRRAFLGQLTGAIGAAGLSISATSVAAAQESGPDDWIKDPAAADLIKLSMNSVFDIVV